jgi:protein ImuA
MPSTPLPVPGVGRARWLLELIRCRAGESADFVVDACDAEGRLDVPADVADRSASAENGSVRA